MSASTTIEWCDASLSPWHGCMKVSEGCARCYAEGLNNRFRGGANWGPGAPRLKIEGFAWNAFALERRAVREGVRLKVFPSMCDPFDAEVPVEWFADFLDVVRVTPRLDWLLLTKRPGLWRVRLEAARDALMDAGGADPQLVDLHYWITKWLAGHAPENVWMGASMENQKWADIRLPELLEIPAVLRFVSAEPMLWAFDMRACLDDCGNSLDALRGAWHIEGRNEPVIGAKVDWVICGGESGPNYRPMDVAWARSLRDQCVAAGVPFFMKQLGGWPDKRHKMEDFPEDLRVREFPEREHKATEVGA